MSEATRMARALMNKDYDSFHTAAAILVALCGDETLVPRMEDLRYVRALRQLGCTNEGLPTPLGRQVAMVLQATHGVTPVPRPR